MTKLVAGYGLVALAHIKHYAQAVCDVLGRGEHNSAVYLLCETAAAETHYGTFRDATPGGAGRGLFQCDEIAFKDVLMRVRQADVDALKAAFDFDLRKVEWDDLNLSPLLAAVVARLHYKLKPEPIPLTLVGRAAYWKKYYNTSLGKGTPAEYIERVKPFQVYF
ncbi:MAG TPA: hypothetical protein VLF09_03120 [Cellvibrio sp.]|nr:hypothetical protein [Cellvibrio sp.]